MYVERQGREQKSISIALRWQGRRRLNIVLSNYKYAHTHAHTRACTDRAEASPYASQAITFYNLVGERSPPLSPVNNNLRIKLIFFCSPLKDGILPGCFYHVYGKRKISISQTVPTPNRLHSYKSSQKSQINKMMRIEAFVRR